jgi:hypothetical protein
VGLLDRLGVRGGAPFRVDEITCPSAEALANYWPSVFRYSNRSRSATRPSAHLPGVKTSRRSSVASTVRQISDVGTFARRASALRLRWPHRSRRAGTACRRSSRADLRRSPPRAGEPVAVAEDVLLAGGQRAVGEPFRRVDVGRLGQRNVHTRVSLVSSASAAGSPSGRAPFAN